MKFNRMVAPAITLAFLLASAIASGAEATETPIQRLLVELVVQSEQSTKPYVREDFKHWIDANGDGCNTRAEVLKAESKKKTSKKATCTVTSGSWISIYDGKKISLASQIDIDHMVPLKEAWDSGASLWDSGTRQSFANDLGFAPSLVAVSLNSNRSKSDRDPSEWLPAKTAHCSYTAQWVAVKWRWGLSVDETELKTLNTVFATCSAKALVTPMPTRAKIVRTPDSSSSAASPLPSPAPTGIPTPPISSTSQLDPKFTSCAEAMRNGYKKPYVKGVNPEYAWYQDRDGDGVVCEK